MKQVTFADKSLLVGDDAADLLISYAAILANQKRADTVDIRAIGVEGANVTATFLLDAGALLMAETTPSTVAAPDNTAAEEYMRDRIAELTKRTVAVVEDHPVPEFFFDDLTS